MDTCLDLGNRGGGMEEVVVMVAGMFLLNAVDLVPALAAGRHDACEHGREHHKDNFDLDPDECEHCMDSFDQIPDACEHYKGSFDLAHDDMVRQYHLELDVRSPENCLFVEARGIDLDVDELILRRCPETGYLGMDLNGNHGLE